MNDLDEALRTMLANRAEDITTMPADFTDLASLDVLDHDPSLDLGRRRRTPWLIAAVVVAMLAIAGAIIGIRGSDPDGRTPPVHSDSRPRPTPTHTAAPTPAVRSDLLRWRTNIVPPVGYRLSDRGETASYSAMQLTRPNDPDATCQCDGLPRTDGIVVYRTGAFDSSKVTGGTPVDVDGHRGFYVTLKNTPSGQVVPFEYDPLPSIAWEYAPDSWATVSARTPTTQRHDQLLSVAELVKTNIVSRFVVPIRLTYVPTGLHVVDASQNLSEPRYGRYVDVANSGNVGSEKTRSVNIHILAQDAGPGFDSRTATQISADGRAGLVSSDGTAAAFRIGKVTAEISVAGPGMTHAVLLKVVQGLRFAPRVSDDEATWVDATTMFG
jgi:hypothetical protein